MKVNAFSFKSYSELHEISKEKKSPLLKIVLAYKNPITSRSINSLKKMVLSNCDRYKEIAREYLFFRLLKAKEVQEAATLYPADTEDELISFVLDTMSFFGKNPSPEEIKEGNFYLYFLLLYFPDVDKEIDLAYGYPNDKYGEGFYEYALLREIYGTSKFRKAVSSSFKNAKGIRGFLTPLDRDALNLFFRNKEITATNFIEYKDVYPLYPELRKLSLQERQNLLERLIDLDAIEIRDGRIFILEGGVFLLGCYNL